jgi:hypothetical protein
MSTITQSEINIDELKSFVKHIVRNNRFIQEQGKMPVAVNIIGESGIGKTTSLLQVGEELGLDVVKINLAQIEELSELTGYPVRQFQLCVDSNKVPAVVVTQEAEPVTRTIKVKKMVKKIVNQEVTVMEEQEVDDFVISYVKKQVLENGKFVSKDIEVKTPGKVMKEVPVTKMMDVEVEEEIEVDELVTDPAKPVVSTISADGCIWVDEQAIQEYLKQGYSFTGQKRMSYCAPEWIADKPAGGILLLDDFNRKK